jgi:hypothetical protein
MIKLNPKAKMSLARSSNVMGGLLNSEYALNDRASPNIKSERVSIRGLGLERFVFSDKSWLLAFHSKEFFSALKPSFKLNE